MGQEIVKIYEDLCSKNAWRPAAPHLSKALQCLRLQHCNTRFWRGMFHLDQGWHRTNASCHSHVTIFVKSFTQKHVVTTQNGRICWICFHFVTDSHRLRNVHVSTMSTAFNSYIRITSSISPLAPPVLYATPHQGLARHRSQPKTAWCGTAWHSFPQRGRSCYVSLWSSQAAERPLKETTQWRSRTIFKKIATFHEESCNFGGKQ